MKRKIKVWLAAGLLFLYSVMPVYAAGENEPVIEAVSGYCLGDEIHTFIELEDGYDIESFKVSLQSDAAGGAEAALVPLTKTGSIVRYIFVVDLSGSMRQYTSEVNAFVEALVTREKQEAFYTVATFGEHFEIVDENLTDINTLKKVLGGLSYTEQLTNPYAGVESALTYLDGCSVRSGDVIHLIMITDGEPDLGYKDEEKEQKLAEAAADKIEKTPEVIVSTFCTAKWDPAACDAFFNGKGLHEQADNNQDAAAAGENMAEYIDGLYRASFKLSKNPVLERFDGELQIRGNSLDGQLALFNIDLKNIPNLKLFSNDGLNPSIQEESTHEVTREETVAPERETVTEESETPSEETDECGEPKNASKILVILIPAAAGIIVAGSCAVIAVKKRKKQNALKPDANAITMKLEVYSGNCISKTKVFYLTDSLIIGSAKKCDLIFANEDVAPQNSRIFRKEGMIYIEDFNSKEGTALGGMRIQGQNRLRSGDVISIGTVEFSMKF